MAKTKARAKPRSSSSALNEQDFAVFATVEERIKAAKLAAKNGLPVHESALHTGETFFSHFPALIYLSGQIVAIEAHTSGNELTPDQFTAKLKAA